jgi:hypothetical protein
MKKTKQAKTRTLATVRASLAKMQRRGERVVARIQRDTQALVGRGRKQALSELRDLERRLVHRLHAASEGQVARLERRVRKLEQMVAALREAGPKAA